MRFAPPAFERHIDPAVVEEWLEEMKKRFTLVTFSEEQKVTLATYMLQGEAHLWWVSLRQKQGPKDPLMMWSLFEKLFYEKYFPNSMRQKKQREFVLL